MKKRNMINIHFPPFIFSLFNNIFDVQLIGDT